MTILFLDQFSDLGGGQKCLVDLLPAMRQRGWKAVVAAPGRGELFEASTWLGASAEPLPDLRLTSGRKSLGDVWRYGRGLVQWTAALRRLVEQYRPDLLYVNGPRMLPVAALGSANRIPLLFHAHSYLDHGDAAALARWAMRRCQATLVASCLFAAGPLLAAAPPARRRLVYNGVAELGFRRSCPSPIVRIGVIGRVAPQKGQNVFVEAAQLVAKYAAECRFTVIGSALFQNRESEKYFERVRRRCHGSPQIGFAGWSGNIAEILAGLDLLVVPSTGSEATTRVIPEAWSAGVPVVASRTGGIAEIVEDGVTGFLVKPGSPAELADRIREVRAMPQQHLNEVRLAARRRYLECFTLERYRDQVSEIIEGAATGSLRLKAQVI
jgi:glycosyltransferase involved in cell wall biosynthesis